MWATNITVQKDDYDRHIRETHLYERLRTHSKIHIPNMIDL